MSGKLMVKPPKRPDEMTVEEAHAIRDSFDSIVAMTEKLREEEGLDGEELSRRLFDAHEETFLQYGQTCFLFISGRVSGERTLRHVRDNIVDPVERGGGDPKRVQQIIEENGVRSHWHDMARDAALANPDEFEKVVSSILENATRASELEGTIRREQLHVLVDALQNDPDGFGASEAKATRPESKSAFVVARKIVANKSSDSK